MISLVNAIKNFDDESVVKNRVSEEVIFTITENVLPL